MVLGAADTLAAAQGAGGEAAEDEDQDMVYEDGHSVPLVGTSCILTRIYGSGRHTNQMKACFLVT